MILYFAVTYSRMYYSHITDHKCATTVCPGLTTEGPDYNGDATVAPWTIPDELLPPIQRHGNSRIITEVLQVP